MMSPDSPPVRLSPAGLMFSFLLVFVFTGIFMINHDLFTMPDIEVNHSKMPVEKPMKGNPGEYTKYLKKTLELKGRTEYQKDNKDNWIFHFMMPGDAYQIKLTPAQDTLHIQHSVQEMTFYMVMHRISCWRQPRSPIACLPRSGLCISLKPCRHPP